MYDEIFNLDINEIVMKSSFGFLIVSPKINK